MRRSYTEIMPVYKINLKDCYPFKMEGTRSISLAVEAYMINLMQRLATSKYKRQNKPKNSSKASRKLTKND